MTVNLSMPIVFCTRWLGNRVQHADIVKIGLEAGNMSSWLYSGLTKLGLPVAVLEAFQAHRFISTQRNKTDKNDARGLAHLHVFSGSWRPLTGITCADISVNSTKSTLFFVSKHSATFIEI